MLFFKIHEHGVINNTLWNFAPDWEKRGRSVVFNTLLVVLFCELVRHRLFPFLGKLPCVKQDLKIILRGLQMDLSLNLSMWILIISQPWALFGKNLLIMFSILSTKKSTSESNFSVIKGKVAIVYSYLSINEHCFTKKELKISLFSLKSVIYLLSWKMFLPF